MKPAPLGYLSAETTDEALAALHEHGAEARILAGGQSLVAMLNMRLARPAVLVDVMRIAALASVAKSADSIIIPAAVRQAALLARPSLPDEVPLLAAALPWVGHYQTRARGTICGSVAHADPSAEIPLCLVALQGEIRLRSKRARRSVPAEAFFAGMMLTDKHDDEMIESVAIPTRRLGTGYAFAELGRRHGDFAIVACAGVVDATRMRQAFANLLDNALKYTSDGGNVRLTCAVESGCVNVRVRDTGMGIPPNEQPRIWERLYRGDKSRSQRGLGLGLSLVKAIVEAHYGKVEVRSESGRGAEFTVWLPKTVPVV